MIIFDALDRLHGVNTWLLERRPHTPYYVLEIYRDRHHWQPHPPEHWRTLQEYLLHPLWLRRSAWIGRMFDFLFAEMQARHLHDYGRKIKAMLKRRVDSDRDYKSLHDAGYYKINMGDFRCMYLFSVRDAEHGWLFTDFSPDGVFSLLSSDNSPLYHRRMWEMHDYGFWDFASPAHLNRAVLFYEDDVGHSGLLYQIADWDIYDRMLNVCETLFQHRLDYVRRHVRDMPVRPLPVVLSDKWSLCLKIYHADEKELHDLYFLLSGGGVVPYRQGADYRPAAMHFINRFVGAYNGYRRHERTTLEDVAGVLGVPGDVAALLDADIADVQPYIDLASL